jgi:hypothetical protein
MKTARGARCPVASERERKRTVAPAFAEALEPRRLLSFNAPVSYNTGAAADGFVPNAAPIGVVSADITGDGKLDLIVAHTADNSIYFLKGNGDGTFQPTVQIPVGEGIQGDVFVGDFNHDGKPDLFLPGTNNQAIVMLGNGDGTFKPAINSSSFAFSGYYPRGWAVGDFNGDGNLDVVCTLPSNSTNTGRYMVLLGNGDGTFKTGIVGPAVLGYSRWVTTGDFNHDGKLDLAVADGQGTSGNTANVELTILLGNGDGTFTLGGHYASPQFPDGTNTAATSNPEDVVVADVNNDGKPDVIESDYDNTINVFLGNGDGTFQAARSFDPGNYPRDVVAADVNGDGKIDLVVTNVGINQGGALLSTDGEEPGSVAVLLGNGDGTFQAPVTYSTSVYPGWTAVGDFNGDGHPDLAVTQVLDGYSVKVMLNAPTSNNQPPTFAQSPSASPTVVTNNSVALSALGADDGGESNLTYTWATVGSVPAPVKFSANGTNASKNTTAAFTAPGAYLFAATATDAQGLSIMDLVSVTVDQATTTLAAPLANGPGTTATPGPLLTTSTPTLGWNAITGETGYQINLYDVTTSKLVSYSAAASATSFTVPAGAIVAGNNYVWNVRGLNGTQSGPPSSNLYFQMPAAVITLSAPTAISPGSTASPGPVLTTSAPALTWSAVTGATGYSIFLANITAGTSTSYTVGASVTSYSSSALVAGDTYSWHVSALNVTQGGPSSGYLFFQIPAAAITLSAPTPISPGSTTSPGPALSTATPTLTWNAITGETGYQINLYDVTTSKLVSYTVGASATSFPVPTGAIIAGNNYVWNVRGLNGSQSGPPSSNLYFQMPAAVITLSAPTAISPGSTTSAGLVLTTSAPALTWSAVTGATGYSVSVANITAGTSTSYTVGASVTSYSPSALLAGDKYSWEVSALNGTQNGPSSGYLFFQMPAAAITLSAPTAVSPGSTTSPGPALTTSALTWNAITGETGYQINLYDVTTSKLVSYTVGASATTFPVPAGAMTAGNNYVWNVRGLNGTQSGPPSSNLYFQMPVPVTLSAPTAVSPGSTTSPGGVLTTDAPTFAWNAVSGITGYQINVYDSTAGKSTSFTAGASLTSYTPGSLTAGDKYVWIVRGLNGTQSGPPSAYFYFQTPPPTPVGGTPPPVTGGDSTSTLTPALTGTLPASVITGSAISVHQTVTLTNTTGGVVHGSAKGLLYLSASTTLDSSSIRLATSKRMIRLKAGKHASFNIRLKKLSADIPNGVYHLVLQMTDPSGVSSVTASTGTITIARP